MNSSVDDPKRTVRQAAIELGFSSVGFAPASPPAHASALIDWLRQGLHADMGWMAREDSIRRRLDPGEPSPPGGMFAEPRSVQIEIFRRHVSPADAVVKAELVVTAEADIPGRVVK